MTDHDLKAENEVLHSQNVRLRAELSDLQEQIAEMRRILGEEDIGTVPFQERLPDYARLIVQDWLAQR